MKATKIRAYLIGAALAALAVPTVAAVLGLGANVALADAVSPTGPFTAALCSGTKLTIKLGTSTTTCTVSTASNGNAQNSPSGQPICGTITTSLTNCSVSSSGFTFPATCTTSGSWTLCASSGGTSSLSIPSGGVVCTANVLGQTCKATGGTSTISGTWTNAPTSAATFTNQTVNVTTSGGFPCPSGTTATLSASYCTSPALTISPN